MKCMQSCVVSVTISTLYSLGLVGVEAGNGHNFGAAPWSTGHSRWGLLPKVFTETSVHCRSNEQKINDP